MISSYFFIFLLHFSFFMQSLTATSQFLFELSTTVMALSLPWLVNPVLLVDCSDKKKVAVFATSSSNTKTILMLGKKLLSSIFLLLLLF